MRAKPKGFSRDSSKAITIIVLALVSGVVVADSAGGFSCDH